VLFKSNTKQSLHLPDYALMKEFMKRHFPNAEYLVERGDTEENIISRLQGASPGALVVLGAYQRGCVSWWFRSSMADFLMRYAKVPLFIAHN
jgi:nucleotide-binding universal stress UspA family protein